MTDLDLRERESWRLLEVGGVAELLDPVSISNHSSFSRQRKAIHSKLRIHGIGENNGITLELVSGTRGFPNRQTSVGVGAEDFDNTVRSKSRRK